MNMATQDLEIIKSEVAGIRDFYQARMDAEIPPIREEVQRIASQLGRMQDSAKEGQKRGILAKYVEKGPPAGSLRQVRGHGPAGLGLRAQPAELPDASADGPQPTNAGGVATEPEGCYGQHHCRLRRRAGTHPRSSSPVAGRKPRNHGGAAVLPH